MAKKRPAPAPKRQEAGQETLGATLKDLLSADVVGKLKAQADAMKAEAASKAEAKRKQEEAAKAAERKRLENDFEYLLNNSSPDYLNKYK